MGASKAVPQTPQQTTDGPSLTETIAYINSHDSTAKLSLSPDANTVQIERDVRPCGRGNKFTCGVFTSFPASQVQYMTVRDDFPTFECPERGPDCMDVVRISGSGDSNRSDNFGQAVSIGGSEDPEMNLRMVRALRRFLALLNEHYQTELRKKRDPNDPFASPQLP